MAHDAPEAGVVAKRGARLRREHIALAAWMDLHDRCTNGVIREDGELRSSLEPECVARPDAEAPPYSPVRHLHPAIREEGRDRRRGACALAVVRRLKHGDKEPAAFPLLLLDGASRRIGFRIPQ